MKLWSVKTPKHHQLFLGLVVLVLVLTVLFITWRSARRENPQLIAPTLALSSLTATSLYFNGPARPWLFAQRPDLLTDDDRDERSDRARGLVQAVQNPQLFRQLDRRYRFNTLLLVGDPSLYRPLLEHLLEAKDWALAYLDHTSLVFRREVAREWRLEELVPLKAHFPAPHDRAQFLAQAAVKLLALRRSADGKACLDEAQTLDDEIPEVWNGLAIYRMSRGEWTPATISVDRALRLDANFLPAIATKTQILYSTKKFSAAYDLSVSLIEAYPDDPGLLFYHAKICHEAHAYTAEIRTLKRLIERAETEARPTTGYHLYLAQAYAAAEQAQPSIDEFKRVLADQEISAAQRQFAEETLAQIKSRTGLR